MATDTFGENNRTTPKPLETRLASTQQPTDENLSCENPSAKPLAATPKEVGADETDDGGWLCI